MNAVQIGLAALAAVFLGALGWMSDWGQGFFSEAEVNPAKVSAKLDAAAVLPDFKLPSESNAYAQIAERPLLNPTRRPAPTQAVAAVAPEPPKPQIRRGLYQLVGVSDFGGVKFAQVREVAGGKVRSVKVGEQLQEMSVKQIDNEKVLLAFQGEIDTLELPKYTASGRIPQPAPPPPVVQQPQLPTPVAQVAPPPISPISSQPVPPPNNASAGRLVGITTDGASPVPPPPPVADAPPQRPGRSMREVLGITRNPSGTPRPGSGQPDQFPSQ